MDRDTIKHRLAYWREQFRLTQSEYSAQKCEYYYGLLDNTYTEEEAIEIQKRKEFKDEETS